MRSSAAASTPVRIVVDETRPGQRSDYCCSADVLGTGARSRYWPANGHVRGLQGAPTGQDGVSVRRTVVRRAVVGLLCGLGLMAGAAPAAAGPGSYAPAAVRAQASTAGEL